MASERWPKSGSPCADSAPATPMTARAGYPEGEAFANIDALHKAKEEKSRTKATVEGAVRHLPEAIEPRQRRHCAERHD